LFFELKASILVVDDDEDIRFFFSNVLSKNDYDVVTAENGKNAISELKERNFDLAILDYMLPDIQGNELANELKNIKEDLNYVFVTGYSQGLLEIGIPHNLIVEKPVFHKELLTLVNNRLNL